MYSCFIRSQTDQNLITQTEVIILLLLSITYSILIALIMITSLSSFIVLMILSNIYNKVNYILSAECYPVLLRSVFFTSYFPLPDRPPAALGLLAVCAGMLFDSGRILFNPARMLFNTVRMLFNSARKLLDPVWILFNPDGTVYNHT